MASDLKYNLLLPSWPLCGMDYQSFSGDKEGAENQADGLWNEAGR